MKKKILAVLLALVLITCTATAALAYDLNTAKEAVVRIVTYFTVTDEAFPELLGVKSYITGSGVVVGNWGGSSTYVATAAHVVMHWIDSPNYGQEAFPLDTDSGTYYLKVHVDEIDVLVADKNSFVVANLEKYASGSDLAVLKLNQAVPRKVAAILDKKEFDPTDEMTAMGFPGAAEHNLDRDVADQLLAGTDQVSTNSGKFSKWAGNATTHQGDQITTTAEMSGGISGGPLVDKNGYVIGICVSGSAVSDNVNTAVASDELVKLLSNITEIKYKMAPVEEGGLSTTTIIIIAAAVVLVAVLLALIIASSKGKKNSRTMVFGGVLGNKSLPLKKGVPIVVGRDPNRCQVVYPKDTAGVSSVHCTITFDGNQVTIADNGSSYGTFVGGTKVEPGKPMVMHRGQEVTFGSDKNSAELH